MIKDKENNTQLDLIDEIYSLGYWMTGSKKDASDLLRRTYLNADKNSSEAELIRRFRICYFDSIGQVPVSGFIETLDQSKESLTKSLWKWFEDIKLTVLLSEIPGLKHREIGEITGNTLETIRLWLSWGRKQLKNGKLLNYSPMSKATIQALKTTALPKTVLKLI
jgi:DNA-directed RNA polymerase specialized sigma24 family protein